MRAIIVLGFACIIGSSFAAPAISAKLDEIRTVVRTSLDDIAATAVADNPEVGQEIKEKLENVAGKAATLLQKAREIATPTITQARESTKEFLALMGEAKEAVKDDVKQLSEPAQKQIKETFKTALAKAKGIVHDAQSEVQQDAE